MKAPAAKVAFVRCYTREVKLAFLKLELMERFVDVETAFCAPSFADLSAFDTSKLAAERVGEQVL